MRLFLVGVVVLASGCESRVSRPQCGGLNVGSDVDGVHLIATAGDRCDGPTPHLSLSLQLKRASLDSASTSDAGMECAGGVFRAHGLDQQGRRAAVTFEFKDPEKDCRSRSARGRLTVNSENKTVVVEDASWAPVD
jgi:hypothetical protein